MIEFKVKNKDKRRTKEAAKNLHLLLNRSLVFALKARVRMESEK
jgi:hypothetical protein